MDLGNCHVAKINLSSAFIDNTQRRLPIQEGINIIIGNLKGNKRTTPQNYLFDAARFSIRDCREWLQKKSIKFINIQAAPLGTIQKDIYSNELKEGEFQLFIRGTIGFDISGIAIAEEIDRLNEEGATKIIERINSAGGDVIDGFNIVAANLRSTATIETINEGVAASMAAVILATGDERRAFDFSTALIHDPMMSGESLENVKDPQVKENLTKIKDSLVKILTDATGQAENIVNELMTRETVMSSKEQRDFGLVNSVIKSRVKKAPANFSILELMNYSEAATATEYKTEKFNIKTRSMKSITNFLNLQEDAAENSVLEAIRAISEDRDTIKNTLEETQNSLAELKTEMTEAQKQIKTAHAENVKLAVNAAIESGKFTAEQREDLTKSATENLVFFTRMVEAVPTPHASALEAIQNASLKTENSYKDEDGKEQKKTWEYYQENDPTGLQNLEIRDPKEFERLYKAYWGEKEPATK